MSNTKSDNKLLILIPPTPKLRSESFFENSYRRRVLRLRRQANKNQNKSHIPLPNISLKKNFIDKAKNIKDLTDNPNEKTSKTPTPGQRNPMTFDIFAFSPIEKKKSKKVKERILSRRPQHMSFRNIYKGDPYINRLANNTPVSCNYEFPGSMLLNVLTHTYKPVTARPVGKEDYMSFLGKKDNLKLHII
ncbi:hypothetical protein SteCoe_7153 [Stentor coeruleus]|uniref:Uncharacterized protein n=1 Tax=Stentor coeruleus TaxID=5963 RepID=A0A1R2CNB7_9CILI|nr:hypothetical protein SteCoe_7153 [Stentor coeruleus]